MIIDGHCDALTKLYTHPGISFQDETVLDVTLDRLKQAGVALQCFAIYMPNQVKEPTMEHLRTYVRLLHERVLVHPEMHMVKTNQDLAHVVREKKIGAMLTLEGADALQGNLDHVEELYTHGVRCLQMTWNYANWAADGVQEPRQAALSLAGRALLERCEEVGILLDVSHLSEPGFWELCERSRRPFIASHANAHSLCPHPRNLNDDQILAIKKKGGLMGLAFVPFFIREDGPASAKDLLAHIDHIGSLGAGGQLCLGSDFDGIDEWVVGLEHPGKLSSWVELLHRYYSDDFVEGLLWKNAFSFYKRELPDEA